MYFQKLQMRDFSLVLLLIIDLNKLITFPNCLKIQKNNKRHLSKVFSINNKMLHQVKIVLKEIEIQVIKVISN